MANTPGPKTRVALIFGGTSSEHPISCATAAAVLQAIDRTRYDVVPIGISPQGRWVLLADDPEPLMLKPGALPCVPDGGGEVSLPLRNGDKTVKVVEAGKTIADAGEVDVVFPLLHGPYGEDGTVQGLLELAGLPYVGCGVAASAMMMDKALMKTVFAAAGLPQVPYVVITDREWNMNPFEALERAEQLEFPVFVKPARAGSSMGVSRVRTPGELRAAIESARNHDPKVIIEQGVVAREIECGILGGGGLVPHVSPIGEITVEEGDFYDFEAKYLDASTRITVPADVPHDVAVRMEELALIAYDAAGCEGLSRVDFFYTPDGELLLNEINTMPGFTPSSMFPRVWQAAGLEYPELIDELISQALTRRQGLR